MDILQFLIEEAQVVKYLDDNSNASWVEPEGFRWKSYEFPWISRTSALWLKQD